MGLLDNQNHREKIDQNDMLSHLKDFPNRVEKAIADGENFTIPTPFINIKRVILLGMGGSGIASKILEKLCFNRSSLPVMTIEDFSLPKHIDKQTIVIATSYSGETEEVIYAFVKAAEKEAKLLSVSSGGSLEVLSRKYKNPHLKIDYSAPPRTVLPYFLTSILIIFGRLNILENQKENLLETVLMLQSLENKIGWGIPASQNPAKQLAEKLFNKIPIFYGSDIASMIAERWKQQINENSKQVAFFEIIPEVCHNGVEGWQFPRKFVQNLFAVLIQSQYDSPQNKLRHSALIQFFQKQGISHETILLHPSGNLISEIFQTIMFGDYVSYYLALLNGVDPLFNKNIDFIKEKISEG